MASAGADKIKKKNEQNNLNMQTEEEKRDMFAKVKVDRGGTRAMVLLPGLSYNDFDRTGNVAALEVISRFSTGGDLVCSHPNFTGTLLARYSDLRLRLSTELIINAEVYTKAWQKWLDFPMTLVSEVSGFGKSSINYKNTLFERETGLLLAEEEIGLCTVERRTRKPCPLPEEVTSMLDQKQKGKRKILSFPEQPSRCPVFTYEFIPGQSDTDLNYHVNYAVYLRYVMNCAAAASYSGFYTNFQGDIMNYKVKFVKLLYEGEALSGDKLEVTTWEDMKEKHRIHFHMYSGPNKVIRCTLDFYPAPKSKY